MDCKVKIWDVYNSGKCMRTYMGHGKAVRDICFSNDGTKFLTAGYDKNIKYWDTETGQKIVQWDINSGEITQEYDQHLGAVNTITFVDNNRRFSCRVFKTLRCHNGVCIGAEWHPLEQSKVATCGWDGLIKYW
ncbi:BnaCnng28120D [Brassica napus]|uniref:BnaCnng28120D protein n=1 Tax=Brassica napus TaxID=3708 RepID=A0A078J085_BRANA|nr:BnaCnng28120D [Brassica napus]